MLRTLTLLTRTSRLALRSSAQYTAIGSPSVRPNLRSLPVQCLHSSAYVRASAGDPMQGIDTSHPFIKKLQSNPQILQQLADFTILLQEKGLDASSGKQPGFGQIMKLMSDPEVKEKAAKLAQDMQAAGIQMDMNTVMELQKAFGGPRSAEGEEQENGGLLNKAKGFFKK
ncbi:hypothetical protein K450DRAFT_223268 [Umbelopsis ramanniana AG]|uniref:Uncharacterized protein n=1 Tax=Umbelopsis ramanniana AG TaxID=1314678 RepID=A0AAD5EI66_UMBRA|nr:uncharacterized protein K450DRAFT_223268 [Umbelopsis ramanniana AG]KAI8583361.1 hypothetical protein K450DRAFT_223268 [Umbelopsis ramanniana AG]